MALVLAERDYKLLTLFTKIAGIFLFAAGTITLVDHHNVALGLSLVAAGGLVTLAPVPLTVVQPEGLQAELDAADGTLSVDARM